MWSGLISEIHNEIGQKWTESANLGSTASPFERYPRRQGRPSKSAKPSRAIKSLAVLTGENWMRVQRSASFALDPDSSKHLAVRAAYLFRFFFVVRSDVAELRSNAVRQCVPCVPYCVAFGRSANLFRNVNNFSVSILRFFRPGNERDSLWKVVVPEFEKNAYDRGFGWVRYPILMYIHQICHWNDTILMNHQILGFSIQHVYGLFKAPHLVVHHKYVVSGSGL